MRLEGEVPERDLEMVVERALAVLAAARREWGEED
jgi:hypothetical protein